MKGIFKAALVALALLLQGSPSFATETNSYTYDELGRLVAIATSGTVNNGQNVSTEFDPAGNRENYSVAGVANATISISDTSVTEGGQLSFTVARAGNTGPAVSVNYATTTPATATSGSDFTAASGTVTFASGDTSEIVTISTTDDATVEFAETLTVALSNPSPGATITTASATGTINDNDAASATISIGNATVTEGGTLSFTVTRSGNTSNAVSASYATASGTATSGSDFTANTGTVSFAVNDTSETITVSTTNDLSPESAENMTVTLSNPSSGAALGTAIGTGTINDNDFATISIGDATVTEGGTLSFTVTRSGVTSNAVSASYATASGTATSGSDFTAKTGTVSFAANDTSETITVSTTNDSSPESAENMTVTLSNPSSGATLGTAIGTGTINDNDFAILSIGNATVTEGSTLSFTVTRSGITSNAVSASYATASGTATSGSDFTAKTGTVSFAANDNSETITVSTTNDSSAESNETMTVTLSNPSSGASLGTTIGTGTINDNDFAILSIGNATVTEGATLSFTVTRSGVTNNSVSASYATASGTATSGSDFTAKTGTVSFPANDTTETITVTTTNDSSPESTETMTVGLSSPSSGATLGTATGTGTINDNDTGGGGIITPLSYSASSSLQSYTGLNGTGAGMRDAIYDTSSSIHGTNNEAVAWIIMDLGSSQSVGNVVVVPAAATAPGGWGAAYLNGAILQQSPNGTTWTTVATIAGASEGVLTQIPVNTSIRYLRLRMANNYLAVGDFYARAP